MTAMMVMMVVMMMTSNATAFLLPVGFEF